MLSSLQARGAGRWTDFASQALKPENYDDEVSSKIWYGAKALGLNPFSEEFQKLTFVQVEWAIEMYLRENPEKGKVIRKREELTSPEIKALWLDKVTGKDNIDDKIKARERQIRGRVKRIG